MAIIGQQAVSRHRFLSSNSSLCWRFLNQLTVGVCSAGESQAVLSLQVGQEMALLRGEATWPVWLDLIHSKWGLIMVGRETRLMPFPSLPRNEGAKRYVMKRQHLKSDFYRNPFDSRLSESWTWLVPQVIADTWGTYKSFSSLPGGRARHCFLLPHF